VPALEAERATVLRSITADKKVLFVLDDVTSMAQVRALLPSSPASRVIVTSRKQLMFDVGRFREVVLDRLSDDHALAMLSTLCGRDLADDPDLPALLTRCGGLPLALEIVAAKLRQFQKRPMFRLLSKRKM